MTEMEEGVERNAQGKIKGKVQSFAAHLPAEHNEACGIYT